MIVTGKGGSGSWKIRGEQLGAALGATVVAKAEDVRGEDVLVIKKDNGCNIKGAKTIIWDVVDCWPQPDASAWSQQKLIDHIKDIAARMKVDKVIAATKQMALDLDTPYYLYHHGRTYAHLNPIREHVRTVGYEGSYKFLGRWGQVVEEECRLRGWKFVVNPVVITDCDILVALRDVPYRGYASDNWKSNIKLANAQNSGTPIICNSEKGYTETYSGAELWADMPDELRRAFNILDHQGERLWRAAKLREKTYTVEMAAADFKRIHAC